MLIMNSPTEKSKGKAYLQEPQKSVRSMFNQNKEKDENDKMLMKESPGTRKATKLTAEWPTPTCQGGPE